MSIRPAKTSDIPALLDIGEAMHAESPRYSRLTFSRTVLTETLANVVERPWGFAWVKDGAGGRIDAVMIGLVAQHWCSTDRTASDLALYVRPECRGGTAAPRLIREFVRWAKEQGAAFAAVGVTAGINEAQAVGLYTKLGAKHCGTFLEF